MEFNFKAVLFAACISALNVSWLSASWMPQTIVTVPRTETKTIIPIDIQGAMTIVSDDRSKKITLPEQYAIVSIDDKHIAVNNRKITDKTIYLFPSDNKVTIAGRIYRGPLSIHSTPKSCSIFARQEPYTLSWETLWAPQVQNVVKPYAYKVKVLINELTNPATKLTVTSDSGFIVFDSSRTRSKKYVDTQTLSIQRTKKGLSINGKNQPESLMYVHPRKGYASINGQDYHGSFLLKHNDQKTVLINHVELEEYIYAVLKTESWPGWPLEVNKSLAIACRSYVMAMLKRSQKSKLDYHVKNTNEHQTYKGMHTDPVLKAAVDQTRGLFLAHNNEPALAMFDCCCGGIIPAHVAHINFKEAPYLKRDYVCDFCKSCKLYTWNAKYDHAALHNHIKPHLPSKTNLSHIKIGKKDKAGLVQEMHIKQDSKDHVLTAQKFYTSLKDIKSFAFNIQKKDNHFIFEGRGYGHHVGMCQWGAREMVRKGWSYNRILQFYYPGTNFMRLAT